MKLRCAKGLQGVGGPKRVRRRGDEIWELESGMQRKEKCCVVKQEENNPKDESTAPPGTAPDGFSSYSQHVVFQQTGSRGDGCEAVI